MRRAYAFTMVTLLFVSLSLAAPQAAKKDGALRCTLTKNVIEKCCCEQKDGKTYCPLAKKSVDKCCCEPAAAKAKAPAKKG